MLPHRNKPKIDISSLTEEERKLFSLYGKLPKHKTVLSKVHTQDRKYFDSGDYALSKAGFAPQETVGTAIPNPQTIPHASPPSQSGGLSISPTNLTTPSSSLGSQESSSKSEDNSISHDDDDSQTQEEEPSNK